MKPSGTSPVKSRGILWASPRRFVLRLSTLVKLVSDSILVGFKAGAGLTISMTQLPSLFGVAGGGQNFFERAVLLAGQFDQMNYLVLAVGTIAILLLVFGERLIPGKPAALGVVALAIIAASLFGLPALGAPRRGQFRPACPPWRARRCGCATSRGLFRSPPDACCSPTSRASRPPAPSRQSTDMPWTPGRSFSASARQIWRRPLDKATRSPADCRNRP
jgi:Sulfate permease family